MQGRMDRKLMWAGAGVMIFCLVCSAGGTSFVGVTTWPSFRLGNDLGRFDWYLDLNWSSYTERETRDGRELAGSELIFEPALGCNVTVFDTTVNAYVGGMIGTWLRFENAEYSGGTNLDIGLGGGLEVPLLNGKISILGEYLLGFWISFLPDNIPTERNPGPLLEDQVRYGFHHIPSIQFRYYIGPF